ncbi:START domain-containing protein [Portibacter lacus]|uniref:START domain-containing protein n=1 Tax=Portibacter lacus TaxID=1099794 RepID=A0AA37SR24_9BACT|nr:START domain-containing protein [Portibacter lacus]GLR18407.1 hypothetical protein GCM10007940_30230 [Portibacter lacus]
MIKTTILSFFLGIISFSSPLDTIIAQEWNFVKEENGVKLYSRSIDGFEFKEVKAILNLNIDMNKAKEFLLNPNNIEKWMSGCKMSIVKKSEGNKKEYYSIFDAPWPVSDRDDYGEMILAEDAPHKLRIDFRSLPHATPKVSSMVRVPYSKGHIVIRNNKDGSKELVYQFLVDRGGTLPNYIKEYLENSSPVKTVHQLKVVLEQL